MQLEDASLGGNEQCFIEAALDGESLGQHVARIGKRLGAAQDAPRRVDDESQTKTVQHKWQGLCKDERCPPLVSTTRRW